MKHYLFFAMLFISVKLKAQETIIGQSKETVSNNFSKFELVRQGNTDSLNFIEYKISQGHELVAYFNKNNSCRLCADVYATNESLIAAIKDLNQRFDKILAYEWINKDATVEVYLKRSEDSFVIYFKPI